MLDKKERIIITSVISVPVIMLVALVIWRAAFFIPAPQFQTERFHHEHSPPKPPAENADEFTKADTELSASYKPSLNNVIETARTWKPAYTSWFGQKAPDFALADIKGKQHKLSNYRGKNVMIIFWATWCGPCMMEIPHLIALRNIISEDKLAMLAISNENPSLVKQFAADKKINYTVFSADASGMPAPYNRIKSIPCSFFIDSEGKIKLATEGLLSLGAIKAILQAE